MTSFIKKDKRKRNLLNKTINSIKKDFSFYMKNSIKSNHNIPKKKEPQNIYMNYFKKKKKLQYKLEVRLFHHLLLRNIYPIKIKIILKIIQLKIIMKNIQIFLQLLIKMIKVLILKENIIV